MMRVILCMGFGRERFGTQDPLGRVQCLFPLEGGMVEGNRDSGTLI